MLLFVLLSCLPPRTVEPVRGPQVRYRPVEAATEDGQQLILSLPKGQWDAGLESAASELLSLMPSRLARLTAESVRLATARAGFPGQARFAKLINGGAFPDELVTGILDDVRGRPVDAVLVSRNYGDGIVLWLAGWAPHLVELDPLPLMVP